MGSVVKITDREGKEVWSNDYKPFGGETGNAGIIEHGAVYTGKDVDPETGLHYFNARWYDSDLGRFVTEDPIKDGNNWYVYVSNNPLVFIDPTGLFRKSTYRRASNEIISPAGGGGFNTSYIKPKSNEDDGYDNVRFNNPNYVRYLKTEAKKQIAGPAKKAPTTPKVIKAKPVTSTGKALNSPEMTRGSSAPIIGPPTKPEAFEFPGMNDTPVEMPGAGNGAPVEYPAQNGNVGIAHFPGMEAPGAQQFPGQSNVGIGDPQGSQEILLFGGTESSGNIGPLLDALEEEDRMDPKKHPAQIILNLEDGNTLLFRKDFGDNAHAVEWGGEDVDHYNIEIQRTTPSGKVRQVEDLHIVPNDSGSYTVINKNKRNIFE